MEHTFWTALDKLVEQSGIIIDRPKGLVCPVHPGFIYQVDYGLPRNISSMDRENIDVWAGSGHTAGIDAILCTVGLLKRDSEVKILLGYTEREEMLVYEAHSDTSCMKGILVRRTTEISYKPWGNYQNYQFKQPNPLSRLYEYLY